MAAATYVASLRDTVLARALQRKRINRIRRVRERERETGWGGGGGGFLIEIDSCDCEGSGVPRTAICKLGPGELVVWFQPESQGLRTGRTEGISTSPSP